MYSPSFFKEADQEKIRAFIRQQRFGILVNSVDGVPLATHIPFEMVALENGEYVLQGHLARGNAHWRQLEPESEVLVIFQGPHGYVSPRWYDHVNVPSMNYIAAHAYGKPRLVEDFEEVYGMLKRQIESFEGENAHQYNIGLLPEKFLKAEIRGIMAIEIAITRLEAIYKLSQNRDESNYRNILAELSKSEDPKDQALLAEMRKVYESGGHKQHQ
jgi:transcriptional regulator